MFINGFSGTVYPGESISCELDGFTVTATIHARRDGCGVDGGKRDGETARKYTSRAAMADYDRLRRWCNDDWF